MSVILFWILSLPSPTRERGSSARLAPSHPPREPHDRDPDPHRRLRHLGTLRARRHRHAGGAQFGVGGVDELKPLVDDVAVELERVHAAPHVRGLVDHDDVESATAEHLGAAKSGETGADDDRVVFHV